MSDNTSSTGKRSSNIYDSASVFIVIERADDAIQVTSSLVGGLCLSKVEGNVTQSVNETLDGTIFCWYIY